jgi:hypothetical protein
LISFVFDHPPFNQIYLSLIHSSKNYEIMVKVLDNSIVQLSLAEGTNPERVPNLADDAEVQVDQANKVINDDQGDRLPQDTQKAVKKELQSSGMMDRAGNIVTATGGHVGGAVQAAGSVVCFVSSSGYQDLAN